MDIFLIILSILCLLAGVAGCILPMLPGPPMAYLGVLLLHFTDKVQFTTSQLVVWLLIAFLLQVLDYFTPMLGTKYGGGTRYGKRGCVIGTIIGLFFMPWGIIFGPFMGAFIGEILGGNNTKSALRVGFAALAGFLMGTLLKLIVCFYFIYECCYALLA